MSGHLWQVAEGTPEFAVLTTMRTRAKFAESELRDVLDEIEELAHDGDPVDAEDLWGILAKHGHPGYELT